LLLPSLLYGLCEDCLLEAEFSLKFQHFLPRVPDGRVGLKPPVNPNDIVLTRLARRPPGTSAQGLCPQGCTCSFRSSSPTNGCCFFELFRRRPCAPPPPPPINDLDSRRNSRKTSSFLRSHGLFLPQGLPLALLVTLSFDEAVQSGCRWRI